MGPISASTEVGTVKTPPSFDSDPILRLEPWLKAVMWGTDRLQALFGKRAALDTPLGEAWEVSTIPGRASTVAGRSGDLCACIAADPGRYAADGGAGFPLLVKLLAAGKLLSLQVHPDDAQAAAMGREEPGKHEAWLILDAAPGAYVYLGLAEGVSLEDLERAIARDSREAALAPLLRRVEVRPGDLIDVAPGTIHAIGPGLTLLEVQQPSDLTYRVSDWGRLGLDGQPRQLHIEESLRVARPESRPEVVAAAPRVASGGRVPLLATDRFLLEGWAADGDVEIAPAAGPEALVVVAGQGQLSRPGLEDLQLTPGRSFLLPRGLGSVRLHGTGLRAVAARPA